MNLIRFSRKLVNRKNCPTIRLSCVLWLASTIASCFFSQLTLAQPLPPDPLESNSLAEEHLRLGIDFFLTDELEIAIDEFQEAARLQPGYADAHHNLGVVLAKSGDLTGALAAWSQAQRLDPSGVPVHYHLSALVSYNYGVALLQQGELDRAIDEWKSAIRIQPDFAEAHYGEGLGYLAKGNALQAITKFQQALSWRSDWPMAHHQLGVAYFQTREFQLAEQSWHTALALQPALAQTHSNLGLARLIEGNFSSAMTSFQRAIALDGTLPEAHYNLGVARYSTGEWQAAQEAIESFLTLRPQFLSAHHILGATWANLGQWGKAISEWRTALQAFPAEPEAAILHYNIGLALFMMSDAPGAIGEFRRTLMLRPKWAKAHYHLGTVAALTKDLPLGLEHFQKVVIFKPSWAQGFFSLGKVHYQMGAVTQAIEALYEATRLEPQFADASYHLGVILRAHSRSEEAIAPLQVAAKAGIEDAQSLLASMYANGSGVDRNVPMSMIWWAKVSSTGSSTKTAIQAKERLSQLRRQMITAELSSSRKQEISTGFSLIRQGLRHTIRNVDGYAFDQSLGKQLAQDGRVKEAVPILIQEAFTLDEVAHTELERLYLNGVRGKLLPYHARILDYFLEMALEQHVQSCEFLKKLSIRQDLPDSEKISRAEHACY